jgi:transketolase
MVEYTQEQLDALIKQKVDEATRNLYTKADLDREVTKEVDRRVESGIQKGLETQKSKWEKEFAEKAQMSAEELAQKEYQAKLDEITQREKELAKTSNLIEAKNKLAEAEVPKTYYEKLLDTLVKDDTDVTNANVTNFIESYKNTVAEIEGKMKSEYTKVKPPIQGENGPTTKQDFTKMSYGEKLKFKQENPEQYKEFIK